MRRAVVFDFDGVLVDSEHLRLRAFRAAANGMGFRRFFGPVMDQCAGSTDAEVYRSQCRWAGRPESAAGLAEFSGLKLKALESMLAGGRVSAYPGAVRLLFEARSLARTVVCASATGREVEMVLKAAGLERLAESIMNSDDVPTGEQRLMRYVWAVRRMGLRSRECVAVVDTVKGIKAARAAGLAVVGVGHSTRVSRLRDADLLAGSCERLCLEDVLAVERVGPCASTRSRAG